MGIFCSISIGLKSVPIGSDKLEAAHSSEMTQRVPFLKNGITLNGKTMGWESRFV